ncbi:glycosyltransferase family 9 protein [Desulfovibrio mangrovi]|uniref:glycosyltransferase family 9 protein n=1 Tax=Desulfovibrio mangrovi TaxID=2976983 RepID=UPI0022484E24|nr:glycosyltransferase family 9 protein [Desulfovibrio mangrovi]UZP69204.1 glycosyltransferase family 9 protein [Desulfovibrio mangrovi]
MRRILVCQLRQIGDVLLATASISLLKRRFPDAEIHVLTEKKCLPMLENNPDVGKVWAIDKGRLNTLFKELAFYWTVARQGYDIVVDFQQLPRCRWVVGLSAAPVRLSYTPEWYNRWLFTHTVKPLDGYSAMAKASVLRPLGIEWNSEPPRLYLTDAERRFAADYLARYGVTEEHRVITVDPTHRRATRRWPARYYAALIAKAAEAHPDLRFLLLYGPGELEDARAVLEACPRPEAVILPDEIISLREMAACIERAVLHIGNCSSPRHIAVALGVPSFIVLGATSPAWTFPAPEHTQVSLGMDCQPCNRNSCEKGYACLEGLSPDVVWEAMQEHMVRCGL